MKAHMQFAGLLLVGLCCSSPALADVAGRYETTDKNAVLDIEMTVETDDAGDVRFQTNGTSGYYLLHDGELYSVQKGSDGYTVVRIADLLVVKQEAMERLGWKEPKLPDDLASHSLKFAPMGEETVRGREGTAYGMISKANDHPVYASFVIGTDPKLAPLGRAMALADKSSIKGMGSMATMLSSMSAEMMTLLQNGAPLRMLKEELTDVSFDPIPKSRFELPAEPLTIDELRKSLDNTVAPPPTLPPREK